MGSHFPGRCRAIIHGPVPVIRMDVIVPECGFRNPALHRVAEQTLGLLADEGKLKRSLITFPDNAVNRFDERLMLIMRLP